MGHHEFVVFDSDPDHGDLRAAVAIERGQMSKWSFVDHFAYRLRNFHEDLSVREVSRGWCLFGTMTLSKLSPYNLENWFGHTHLRATQGKKEHRFAEILQLRSG